MGVTLKKISVILLLVAFLTPGLAQAKVFGVQGKAVARATETGYFNMVWNLLSNMFAKNGNQLDPSGCTIPGTCGGNGAVGTGTTTTPTAGDSDNGNMLDPSGQPK